jgi:nucleolin
MSKQSKDNKKYMISDSEISEEENEDVSVEKNNNKLLSRKKNRNEKKQQPQNKKEIENEEEDSEIEDNEDNEIEENEGNEIEENEGNEIEENEDNESEDNEEINNKDNEIEIDEENQTSKTKGKNYTSGTWKELFVKNLSYQTTEKQLAEYFGKYGDVELSKIVYNKENNKSKGIGFVQFYEPESATKAMNDSSSLSLDGRVLKISYSNERSAPKQTQTQPHQSKPRSNNNSKYSIFVANLNFDSNEQGIRNFFKDCGKITGVRIAKSANGKSRGFAHVDFDSQESLDKAMKKRNCRLDKRRLRLEISGQPIERNKSKSKNKMKKNINNTKNKKTKQK